MVGFGEKAEIKRREICIKVVVMILQLDRFGFQRNLWRRFKQSQAADTPLHIPFAIF